MDEEKPSSIPEEDFPPVEPETVQEPGPEETEAETPEIETTTLENPELPRAARRVVLGERLMQIGLNLLLVGVVSLAIFLAWQRFGPRPEKRAVASATDTGATAAQGESGSAARAHPAADLPPFPSTFDLAQAGVLRYINLDTRIPSRTRTDVITYTVKAGDTLFAIADQYGLEPETILWGNFEILKDNPHLLSPDQVLNILPENGVYYQWQEGDSLAGVAAEFQVAPDAILSFSGNDIDLTASITETAGIDPGDWLVIPGGKRPIKDWGPPAISRENPASARYYGEGHCGSIYEGAFGSGTFVWPTVDRSISGYSYSGIHPAIDIAGAIGNAVFAADSGVIVYAGWSIFGYGNLIVVDHGNGWQTAYAHLDTIGVACGQSVFQGGYIGGLGSTGNSSGPHLHFELVYNGAKPNPMDYLR